MNPAALSPEECHRLAQEHIASGDLSQAARLLQVAILKAPSEPSYRAQLEALRAEHMRQLRTDDRLARARAQAEASPSADDPGDAELAQAEVTALRDIVNRYPDEPEHMLRLACHLDTAGDTQDALSWARKATELADDSLDAHLLVMTLHKRLGNKAAAERARRDVRLVSGGDLGATRAARRRLKQMGLKEQAVIPLLPGRGQRLRAALLVALLLVTAAGWWLGRPLPPVPVDPAPFASLTGLTGAMEHSGTAELILTLDEAGWDALSMKDRRDRLLDLFDVAGGLGYRRLLVQDTTGLMMGLAEAERIYLRQFGAEGMEPVAGREKPRSALRDASDGLDPQATPPGPEAQAGAQAAEGGPDRRGSSASAPPAGPAPGDPLPPAAPVERALTSGGR